MEDIPRPSFFKSRKLILGFIIFLVALGASAAYWFYFRSEEAIAPQEPVSSAVSDESEDAALGETLYEQTQNPIGDKLPETVAPVANPVEDLYKNPFE